MPLQIRRGSEAERTQITPTNGLVEGELLYTTDQKKLYIGSGSVGEHQGVVITGYNDLDAKDAAASIFADGEHTGITFTYDNGTKALSAVVDVSAISGPLVADALQGSVFADDSSLLVDAIDKRFFGNLTGDVTGSIFADDSGIMVDAVDRKLFGELTGSVFADDSGILVDAIDKKFYGDLNGSVFADDSGILVDAIDKKFYGDLNGSVFADDSTMLVDGANGEIVGPINSGLSNAFETNGFPLVAGDNSFVTIDGGLELIGENIYKNGSLSILTEAGRLIIGNNDGINGNLYIVRNNYSNLVGSGFSFAQHHETSTAVNFTFFRSRGTANSLAPIVNGDEIGRIVFFGRHSTSYSLSAAITVVSEGDPIGLRIPTKIQFGTDNGTANNTRAELSATGIWKVNSIQGLTSTLNITGNVTGDVTGSVFADNSAMVIDGTEGGKITSPSVTLSSFLKLPVYDDDTARTAGIPSPEKGMVIFITAGTTPAATNQMQVFDGSNWVNV